MGFLLKRLNLNKWFAKVWFGLVFGNQMVLSSSMVSFERTIEQEGITVPEMIKRKGKRITIDIPGMPNATINSVKFRSNMLSPRKGDLMIKTR